MFTERLMADAIALGLPTLIVDGRRSEDDVFAEILSRLEFR